jgi:lysophospholipase L1-like esterase
MNFGVSGYNLDQETEALRTKALKFEPDLIIVAFCLNDLEDIFSYDYGLTVNRMERIRTGSLWQRLYEFGLDHSMLLSVIQYRLIEYELRQQYVSAQYEESPPVPSKKEQEVMRDTLARKMELLKSTAAERLSKPIPILFAIFPTFDFDYRRYPNHWVHGMVAAEAMKSGFTVVDLLPAFSRFSNKEIRADIIHPNAQGHRIAAQEMFSAIKNGKLLDGVAR